MDYLANRRYSAGNKAAFKDMPVFFCFSSSVQLLLGYRNFCRLLREIDPRSPARHTQLLWTSNSNTNSDPRGNEVQPTPTPKAQKPFQEPTYITLRKMRYSREQSRPCWLPRYGLRLLRSILENASNQRNHEIAWRGALLIQTYAPQSWHPSSRAFHTSSS